MKVEVVTLTPSQLESIIERAVAKGIERVKPLLLKAASEYLTAEETALRFGISKRQLDDWRRNAEGPAYIVRGKLTLYKVADVDAWLNGYRIEPELS